jgi:hypothetical protein
MKKIIFFVAVMGISSSFAQNINDTIPEDSRYVNSAQRLLSQNQGITLGAYGEITYNQPESDNGELDIQRMVILLGYNFNNKVQFISEIEFEHVQEVFVEQAFINYSVADNVSLRGGLMLVPMGIVNEYHEPTTFNGTERPAIDGNIVPTTWREIGVGVSGRIPAVSLGYQAYIFNGFKSTVSDNEGGAIGLLKGSNGLRGGRQKGIQSTVDSPTLSTKLDYYGLPGLRIGLAGYFGKTQAEDEIESLEGSTIGISMIGLDARYRYKKFSARGSFIYASLNDTKAYNDLTGKDLGSALRGYYVEAAYNLLATSANQKLVAFTRYENYDTHDKTDGIPTNDAYNRTDITTGLSYHIAPGVVVKGDYQFRDNKTDDGNVKNRLNFGIGVWF